LLARVLRPPFLQFFFEVPITMCMYRHWGFSRTNVACFCDFQYMLQFWEWRQVFFKGFAKCWKSGF
jgi:hypothetical protein